MPLILKSLRDIRRRSILLKRAFKKSKSFTCHYPGCTHKAIGSHVLQENGVLDQIAEERHIIEYAPTALFNPEGFNRVGLGASNMMIFRGFCGSNGNNHDESVFREIEGGACDFVKYRQQLLSSYRGLCN
ncbi:MAG: hypothetical protein ACRYG7_44030 [Janthinobacterium lividum]